MARQHGVPPLAATFWMTLVGAGLLLTPILARALGGRWREKLRYGLIAGALGVGIPTAIVVIVSLHAGVDLTSVTYAFPPESVTF